MRPGHLDEVVGQSRALRPGSILRRTLESDTPTSIILWGPPGSGKTTLARLLSRGDRRFVMLSAAEVGVGDVRQEISSARKALALESKFTTLFVDEIHRFNKSQQDSLLGAVENGTITLVAATTENPSVSVIKPLLSRVTVVKLEPLGSADIVALAERALASPRGLDGRQASKEALELLASASGGDARRALTLLESAASSSLGEIGVEDIRAASSDNVDFYDLDGKEHYENTSALIKSIRGSDVDAALHYLGRMLSGGEDPRFIARRLVISASEDIGTADSNSLQVAVAAAQAVELLGMPEGGLALAHATVHLSMAPKSDAVSRAMGRAFLNADQSLKVPEHIAWHNSDRYVSPHVSSEGVIKQNYRPEGLAGTPYYEPKKVGFEARFSERLEWLRQRLGLKRQPDGD